MADYAKLGVYTRNDEDFQFHYNTTLTANDKVKFVKFVTESLIDDNYYSIIKDLIFDFAIIEAFTDIDTEYLNESSNMISEIESLIEETNIVDIVRANAEPIIMELEKAVNDNISYRTGIRHNSVIDSLTSLINVIERKIDSLDVNLDMNSMMKMADVIGGINGEFTPDKMIDALSKTDIFKKQWEQLLLEKNEKN